MKHFFITGMGRSGTKWTANTIKRYANQDDFVDHKFIGDRNFSIYSYALYSKYKKKEFVKTELPTFSEWNSENKTVLLDICG